MYSKCAYTKTDLSCTVYAADARQKAAVSYYSFLNTPNVWMEYTSTIHGQERARLTCDPFINTWLIDQHVSSDKKNVELYASVKFQQLKSRHDRLRKCFVDTEQTYCDCLEVFQFKSDSKPSKTFNNYKVLQEYIEANDMSEDMVANTFQFIDDQYSKQIKPLIAQLTECNSPACTYMLFLYETLGTDMLSEAYNNQDQHLYMYLFFKYMQSLDFTSEIPITVKPSEELFRVIIGASVLISFKEVKRKTKHAASLLWSPTVGEYSTLLEPLTNLCTAYRNYSLFVQGYSRLHSLDFEEIVRVQNIINNKRYENELDKKYIEITDAINMHQENTGTLCMILLQYVKSPELVLSITALLENDRDSVPGYLKSIPKMIQQSAPDTSTVHPNGYKEYCRKSTAAISELLAIDPSDYGILDFHRHFEKIYREYKNSQISAKDKLEQMMEALKYEDDMDNLESTTGSVRTDKTKSSTSRQAGKTKRKKK